MESAVADTRGSRAAAFGTLVIAPNRCRSALYALILGWVGVAAAVENPTVLTVAIDVVVLGLPCGLLLWRALRRRPLMTIGPQGFTDCRYGRTIPWDNLELASLDTHQRAFGVDRSLHLVLRRDGQPAGRRKRRLVTTNATAEDEIEVGLAGLSVPWESVIAAVERELGRAVIKRSDRGLRNLRRGST